MVKHLQVPLGMSGLIMMKETEDSPEGHFYCCSFPFKVDRGWVLSFAEKNTSLPRSNKEPSCCSFDISI